MQEKASKSEVFALFNWSSAGYISVFMFLKCKVIDSKNKKCIRSFPYDYNSVTVVFSF